MLALKRALVLAAVAAVAALAVACNDTADSEDGPSQAALDELAARVQQDDTRYALITIAGLPMHAMDEAAQEGSIDNKYVPTARTLVRVAALTDWSTELKSDADELRDAAAALLKALDGGDAQEVKEPSRIAHEHWHTFIDAALDVVAKDLPADAGGPSGGAEPDTTGHEGTPDAGGEPMDH